MVKINPFLEPTWKLILLLRVLDEKKNIFVPKENRTLYPRIHAPMPYRLYY